MLTFQQIRNLQPQSLKQFKKRKLTCAQMAQKCGVGITTIYQRLKEYGLNKKYGKIS